MSEKELRQVLLRIRGRVQGVCYRASACDEARALALGGWVRNCSDGSVEAMAVGTTEKIEAFIGWCWRGPSAARVEQVQVTEMPATAPAQGFDIRY
jgi:acylphosphatase